MKRAGLPPVLAALLALYAPGVARAEPGPAAPATGFRAVPLPDAQQTYHQAIPRPSATWAFLQLLPSPELAFGRERRVDAGGTTHTTIQTAFGLRWQLTPVLWSFGVHPAQSRWRWFVVDPSARQSGSIELSASIEYIGGHVERLLARPGVRVYLPLLHKGEYLSTSFGTSVYDYDGLRVAYDVGLYALSGFVGIQATVAPTHNPLATIATFRIRYF